MRLMLVIGAGHFGTNLAVKLTELGNEVMAVDVDEDAVHKLAPYVTRVQIGDCMDRDVLSALGVRDFDVCFVCISDNFQSSMEITSLLKELGAPYVVAKSDREIQADLLKKIGADDVIYPERDMAQRTAVRYSARGAFDYIELSPEYVIMEITPPADWIGRNIGELNVRTKHRINVIGIRSGKHILPLISADHVFNEQEHIIVAGEQKNILKIMNKK
ncbi:TrkA family potassium uptake protein [Caproiciproducens sp. NJN-50]|uniref:potassium channel family protein n=1 Tax=Acutalibacteraceae TaxID=3082771 RepID=UPI000FFE0BDC|nr:MULTISPECIES: TrkA family potassium uptake protein [Acutalibacteraceae]QAT49447.1 TrkA family potassium uptake protein [Caproiciproducens sp. NJN-50]